MIWTSLIWVLLYFAVGWIFTKLYDSDGDMWDLLIFLGWPILAVGILLIFVLLVLFLAAVAVEEVFYRLFRKRRDKA